MKIGNTPSGSPEPVPPSPAGTARASSDDAAKPVSGAGAAESSAQVRLSTTAAGLLTGAKGIPAEFDADKVARIAQAIAEGKFAVNAEAIADKLIANAQEVLGNVKS